MPAHRLRNTIRQGSGEPRPQGTRPQLVYAREDVPGPGRAPAEPVRILVVEDDFFVAQEAVHALTTAGFVVVGTAVTAEEAIELAETERPALVVMDIRLASERDGIDCAIELFKTRGLRSIFATAHADAASRRRADPASPLGWLPKPYTTDSLAAVVREAVKELGLD